MNTALLLHLCDPSFLPVVIWAHAETTHLVVMSSRSCPEDFGADIQTQLHDRIADSAREAMHEDLLVFLHLRRSVHHSIGCRPVQNHRRRSYTIDRGRYGDEIPFGHIGISRFRVIDGESSDDVADLVFGRSRAKFLYATDETVSRTERWLLLHGIVSQRHIDVGATEARIHYFDLNFAMVWCWQGCIFDCNLGMIVEGGDDHLSNRGRHGRRLGIYGSDGREALEYMEDVKNRKRCVDSKGHSAGFHCIYIVLSSTTDRSRMIIVGSTHAFHSAAHARIVDIDQTDVMQILLDQHTTKAQRSKRLNIWNERVKGRPDTDLLFLRLLVGSGQLSADR